MPTLKRSKFRACGQHTASLLPRKASVDFCACAGTMCAYGWAAVRQSGTISANPQALGQGVAFLKPSVVE